MPKSIKTGSKIVAAGVVALAGFLLANPPGGDAVQNITTSSSVPATISDEVWPGKLVSRAPMPIPVAASAEEPIGPTAPAQLPPPRSMSLVGLVYGGDAFTSSAIIRVEENLGVPSYIGDEIWPGVVVSAIGPEYVQLDVNGLTRRLYLADFGVAGGRIAQTRELGGEELTRRIYQHGSTATQGKLAMLRAGTPLERARPADQRIAPLNLSHRRGAQASAQVTERLGVD